MISLTRSSAVGQMIGPPDVRTRMLKHLEETWQGPLEKRPTWKGPPAEIPPALKDQVMQECIKELDDHKEKERLGQLGSSDTPWSEANALAIQDAARRQREEPPIMDFPMAMVTNPKASQSKLSQNVQQVSSVTLPKAARQWSSDLQQRFPRMMKYAGASLSKMDTAGALRRVAAAPG